MFQFTGFASPNKWRMARLQRAGLPHSETRGSIRMCRSPRIFAACRVLLRLSEPRHPPCALDKLGLLLSLSLLSFSLLLDCALRRQRRSASLFSYYSFSQYVNELFAGARNFRPPPKKKTPSFSEACAPSLGSSASAENKCGECRSRTDDLLRARQAL